MHLLLISPLFRRASVCTPRPDSTINCFPVPLVFAAACGNLCALHLNNLPAKRLPGQRLVIGATASLRVTSCDSITGVNHCHGARLRHRQIRIKQAFSSRTELHLFPHLYLSITGVIQTDSSGRRIQLIFYFVCPLIDRHSSGQRWCNSCYSSACYFTITQLKMRLSSGLARLINTSRR